MAEDKDKDNNGTMHRINKEDYVKQFFEFEKEIDDYVAALWQVLRSDPTSRDKVTRLAGRITDSILPLMKQYNYAISTVALAACVAAHCEVMAQDQGLDEEVVTGAMTNIIIGGVPDKSKPEGTKQ